jgi:hypothetical protein
VSMQDLGTNFWLNRDYYYYNKYNGYNHITSIIVMMCNVVTYNVVRV